jgi:hypothetical protein
MPSDHRHQCWLVARGRDWFRCRACAFEGTLAEAIVHAVENQWDATR